METPKFEKLEDTPKKNEQGQVDPTPEEMEEYNQWRDDHPETFTQSNTEVLLQEIIEYQDLIAKFESSYPLNQLTAITDLSADPDRKHPLRDSAKKALRLIFVKLNFLKNETKIDNDQYEQLKDQHKLLANAVGGVNSNGMVDHNR